MRRQLFLAALVVPWPAAGAPQETLRRVRVESAEPALLAAELESEAFDVLEGAVLARSLELVVGAGELAALERRGLAPRLFELRVEPAEGRF